MGRKKKKQSKPWCWYCNREFDDEKILIQHQKAKHFKCHICQKKLFTGPGLHIHCTQVHKASIDKVPNSIPNRCDIEIEIYGMEGIPEADLIQHRRLKQGSPDKDDERPTNRHKPDAILNNAPSVISAPLPAIIPGMFPAPAMQMRFPFMHPPPAAPYRMPMMPVTPTITHTNTFASFPGEGSNLNTIQTMSKIVHPLEDVSLEEIRARKLKYKRNFQESS